MKNNFRGLRASPLQPSSPFKKSGLINVSNELQDVHNAFDPKTHFRDGVRILRHTRRLALGTNRCAHALEDRNPSQLFHIAFYRRSMRVTAGTREPVVVTPNEVTFHLPGERCVRECLTREGGEYNWIALDPGWLPATACLPSYAPLKSQFFFAQRLLFTAFADPPSAWASKQLEVEICEFVQEVMTDATTWSNRNKSKHVARPTCFKRRAQIAQDTKLVLAREFLNDGVSLLKVAESVHCSQSHLGRAFYDTTGLLPSDYRRELRLRKGLFLMEDTSSDIGDIAIHVGFSSHSHFTAAFHQSFGWTPTEFVRWRAQPSFVSLGLAA